ncbi:MAG: hypothetical protein ABJB34_01465, partial [Acidobacteriota bacterium]
MNVLIIKLGATGDVVRTTSLLRRLSGSVIWITASKNMAVLEVVENKLRRFSWEEREKALDGRYDLVINLEDTLDVAQFLKASRYNKIFGAYADCNNSVQYTENAKRWFDLGLISAHGKQQADKLKFRNRSTYQEMVFEGLGLEFSGDRYSLPKPVETGLSGDVAIAADAGPI